MYINPIRFTDAPIQFRGKKDGKNKIRNTNTQSDKIKQKKSNIDTYMLGFMAATCALAFFISAALNQSKLKAKEDDKQVSTRDLANMAIKDAAEGNLWLASPKEINKSIAESEKYSKEKLDGVRTSSMLINFLNSDSKQLQYHAYNVFANLEHDKMVGILIPYLQDRNLKVDGMDGSNIRGQIFRILAEKGTKDDIRLIQQYLSPKDEWYKIAGRTVVKIVKRDE